MTEEQKLTTADIAGRGGAAAVDDGKELTTRDGGVSEPLFSSGDADRYRDQWTNVQSEFVDQPREAVEQADRLVADLMQSLAAQFSDTRTGLESQWNDNDDVSTEDLRVAMTRYRSFFERLLSA
jgi:hypothetical protein